MEVWVVGIGERLRVFDTRREAQDYVDGLTDRARNAAKIWNMMAPDY